MKKEKNLQFYKKLLPERLTLEINKTEEGFWAEVKELPHCYTQGNTFLELIEMINDSIYTYLEVPQKFRKKVGYYLPKELSDEIKRKEWENLIKNMINIKGSELIKEERTLQKCLN